VEIHVKGMTLFLETLDELQHEARVRDPFLPIVKKLNDQIKEGYQRLRLRISKKY
jgi:hypothetical protein